MKVFAGLTRAHNLFGEACWASGLRENLTSRSYGEGLETGSFYLPRQSFTRQLFFKALKQNLKIKTFVGTTANAVKIQIWTALIAMLILKYLQLKSHYAWSLSNLVSLLRMNLFTHRDLWAWLDKPFETLPVQYEPDQLAFSLR